MKDKNQVDMSIHVFSKTQSNLLQFLGGNINLGTIIFATSKAKPKWKVAADICDMLFISKNGLVFVNVFNCWKQTTQK